jgi:DMSO/TMAO reductase YedYZ molybdopterin-dependent catalytic subunit
MNQTISEFNMNISKSITRREFMAAAGGTVVSIGLPGVFVKLMDSGNRAMAAQLRPDGRPRIPPGQHAVKALRNMGGRQRDEDASGWRLKISGDIVNPMALMNSELMELKQTDLICDVHCVTGWTLLDSHWRGISMKTIINLVKVKKTAGFVIFKAPGGYSSSIPLAEAHKDNVILAHGFGNQQLPQAHGAPLRALVPDRYFYKSVKWLEEIKFSTADEPGYYESAGYSNSADPWKEERLD